MSILIILKTYPPINRKALFIIVKLNYNKMIYNYNHNLYLIKKLKMHYIIKKQFFNKMIIVLTCNIHMTKKVNILHFISSKITY